jgi:excisionase family DNA binding protein
MKGDFIMKLDGVLTVKEAASAEGVSRQTIYNWMKLRILPYVQKGGSRLIDAQALKTASATMEERYKNWWSRKKFSEK